MTVTTAPAGMVERRPRPDRLSPAVSLPVVTLLALAMWAGIIFGMLMLIGS
jgi:hypothetical protein